MGTKLSTKNVEYRLPSEAEWEKAGRGGLIGSRWSWGNERPDHTRCDFGHFGAFFVADPRSFPANGYGLFGMCGGVWEWTEDPYDALVYREPTSVHVAVPNRERVLRGGSWSDCAEACSVSFRMARGPDVWAPNIGFRLVRCERRSPP